MAKRRATWARRRSGTGRHRPAEVRPLLRSAGRDPLASDAVNRCQPSVCRRNPCLSRPSPSNPRNRRVPDITIESPRSGAPSFSFVLTTPEPASPRNDIPFPVGSEAGSILSEMSVSTQGLHSPSSPAAATVVPGVARTPALQATDESRLHRPGGIAAPQQAAAKERAKLGIELEVGGAEVLPFLKRGTLLLEGKGWRLETDQDLIKT
jgi:hypothetical protein